MADDIYELLDEVESKYDPEGDSQAECLKKFDAPVSGDIYGRGTEELNAAVYSICGVPASIQTVVTQNDSGLRCVPPRKSGGIMFLRDTSGAGFSTGTSNRKNSSYRRQRPGSVAGSCKRFFAKPSFELSEKDLALERARRKQKEIIEKFFESNLAVVVRKIILDERKYKRIKSNVWDYFGDVRLLISEADIKEFNIDYNVIHLDGEELFICKSFVACVTCCAVFSYESHSYGTSTLRSHLRSCGKPRFNRKDKSGAHTQKPKQSLDDILSFKCKTDPDDIPKTGFEEQRINFREDSINLQKQISMFFLSSGKPFETVSNPEFQKLLQMCIKIGSVAGKIDIQRILCSENQLAGSLIQKLYGKTVVGFTSDMESVYGVSFSFEIWNDINKNMSYLNILCYYSDDAGTLKSVVLQTSEFEYERKGSQDLSNVFRAFLNGTQLYTFRRMLVIDYSPNMHGAFEGEQCINCICHCIDCVVQRVLYSLTTFDDDHDSFNFPIFVELINQCGSLVLHFKHNKIQHNLPNYLHLCSSEWQWKCVLKMLKSISDQWDHITDILQERGELKLFSIDVELMNAVIDFLQIFHDGVVELSSIAYPTLNMVIPWLVAWKTHCLQTEGSIPCLAVLKSFMNAQIDQSVTRNITLFHKLATFLDPRYKHLEFLSEGDCALVQIEAQKLVKECEASFLEKILYDTASSDVSDANRVSNPCSDPQSQANLGTCLNASYEINNYMAETFSMCANDLDTEHRFNPLKYWSRVKSRYPHLSKVASWILSCPASSLRNNERLSQNDWMVSVRDVEYPREQMHPCLLAKSYQNL